MPPPGQSQAPTWGPQPWHGYSIAVWFSSGPWSKQTSFALLLRSCRNRQNMTHQSLRGGASAPQPPFCHGLVLTSGCKGHEIPASQVRTKAWLSLCGDHFGKKDKVPQWMVWTLDICLWPPQGILHIETLIIHWLSKVDLGINAGFHNSENQRAASFHGTEAWKTNHRSKTRVGIYQPQTPHPSHSPRPRQPQRALFSLWVCFCFVDKFWRCYSFFFFLIFKNQSIVDLLLCINLCCSAKWASHNYMCACVCIHTFFLLFYFPSCSITRDWIWFSVQYCRTSLRIHSEWNSLHLLTSNSPSIPLPPPLFLSNHKFVSLFLFRR